MISFPQNLETFLLRYVKATFYRGTKRATFIDRPFHDADLHFFGKGVAELSELFTAERGELTSGYLNQPALRAAYLLYFLPINFAKSCFVLQQLPGEFWSRKKYRVLDLGCGPGSSSLAFLSLLREKKSTATVELWLSDQNKKILEDARALLDSQNWGFPVELHSVAAETRRFRWSGKYDLMLLSHVLNEWVQKSATDRAEWLLPVLENHLSPEGILAILEPALKRPTRELMGLRDHLVESGEFGILAPCLHEEICPMLATTRNDWCHFYLDWQEPEYLQALDRLVQNENSFLKVAYLLLGWKKTFQKLLRARKPTIFRVVSNRMKTRGQTELVLCGPAGGVSLSRPDRERSPANAALDSTRRGDLLEMPAWKEHTFSTHRIFRVTKQTRLLNPRRP